MQCEHQVVFHSTCIREWTLQQLQKGQEPTCPICRKTYVYNLGNVEMIQIPTSFETRDF